MKKFLFKISIFAFSFAIVFISLAYLSSAIIKHQKFHNWETESNLLFLQPNTHYDLMIIGNSHARNFSRYKNHQRVEKILNKSIVNIGQTASRCGVNEYLFYLKYCYSQNITADTILMPISSVMLYAHYNNIASNTFEEEPLDFKFLKQYLTYSYTENKRQKIFYYLRSKLSKKWLSEKPHSLDAKNDSLLKLDSAEINRGFKIAFADGFDTLNFIHNAERIEQIIQFANAHNTKIIFITTPTLFGQWPKHQNVVKFMKEMQKKYNTEYYDFSTAIMQPQYYYDHHHLNTKGIEFFTEKYLKPILENKKN